MVCFNVVRQGVHRALFKFYGVLTEISVQYATETSTDYRRNMATTAFSNQVICMQRVNQLEPFKPHSPRIE